MMNMIKIATLSLLLFPWQVNSAPILLGNIAVELEVTAKPKIEIEKPGGGWYKSIKLDNSPENYSLFQAEVPVTVKLRKQDGYRVSIKNALILKRQTNAPGSEERTFSPAEIRWGSDTANLRLLSTDPETFMVTPGTTSPTNYLLRISALAPNGEYNAGEYYGQLTLIFENNA
jgi:hypothetical protein